MRGFLAQNEDGKAAVELALTAPAFIALLFGALEGGLMLWTQIGLQNAVERAARCAAVNKVLCGNDGAVQAYAAAQGLSAKLVAANFTVTTDPCVSGSASVRFVTLPVTLTARSCFPQ